MSDDLIIILGLFIFVFLMFIAICLFVRLDDFKKWFHRKQ